MAAPVVVTVGSAVAAPKPAKVQFQSSAISVAEGAGQAVVTLRRTGNASGSMTVNYSVTDGSATSGEDYGTATPASLTFAPKVKKLTFTVPIVNDTADELDETILLTLTGTVPAGQVGTPSSATITIVDDDDASTPSLPDDLEGDTSGWTATGLWHLVDDSSCAIPFIPFPIPAYTSATHAFYYGDDTSCVYDTPDVRNSGTLTSPNYSGVTGATSVSFQSYPYTEGDYCQNDIASLDVSYDGGTTWTPLEACIPDTPGSFQLRTYAITPTGDTARFRFTFDTMDNGLNDYPGWFIDDLSVSTG